jgi:pyrophosphatase PpaX
MPVGAVIFDWDGTLARSLDLWVDGYVRAFARRDLRYGPETIVAEFFQEHHLVADRHPHLDFPVIADEARAHVHEAVAGVRLHDGAVAVLEALAGRGLRLALVSSSPRQALERGMAAHGLAGHFASVIAGDDGFGHKPDPLPFAETLGRIGASAAETLVIGDSHVDILAGRAAGCRTCWFAPPENRLFHDFDHLAGLGADHRVSGLADLLGHVSLPVG